MRYAHALLAAALIAGTTMLVTAQSTARAELKDAAGATVGEATLTDTPHGVLLAVSLTNVPEGEHAFHIHETGQCEPPFTTAGGHMNPAGRQHGIENAEGMHQGDLPNVHVPAGGALEFQTLAAGVSLDSLFDADGAALVVHEGPDDYVSDPSGDAGGRIACGVVMR